MSNSLDRLTLLETFVRIAEAGSISSAARDLGLTQPSASRQLASLEARLKTQLVRRNTHSLALTDAGLELLTDARELLTGWESLSEKHADSDVRGRLRVVAPVALGQSQLIGIAGTFLKTHPRVRIAWELDDDDIRFAERGCDCWIKVGAIRDETLIVRKLGSIRRLLVVSTGLRGACGSPGSPDQAEHVPFVALSPYEGGRIPIARGENHVQFRPNVVMESNNIFAVKESVVADVGAAVLPEWFVAAELEDGKLAELLPGWEAPTLEINVAYSPGRHRPRRLNVFLETLSDGLRKINGIDTA